MTADLRGMTLDRLAEAFREAPDETACSAILAETERRDREAKVQREAARRRSARTVKRAPWEEMAYAQYLDADRATAGHLLSRRGMAAGVSDWPGLWEGTAAETAANASEELRNYFLDHSRMTITQYQAQEAEQKRIARDDADRAVMDQDAGKSSEGRGSEMGIPRYAKTGLRAAGQANRARAGAPAKPAVPHQKGLLNMKQAMTKEGKAEFAQVWQDTFGSGKKAARVAVPEPVAVAPPPIKPAGTVVVRKGFPALAGPPARVAATPAQAQPYRTANEEITGADWLNYMRMFFARYVRWPSEAALDTAVLWAAHTYVRESMDNGAGLVWKATPRLFVLSKERNSGKSTVLGLLLRVCPRTSGLDTEPTEYGMLDSLLEEKPTLLIDELGILIGTDKRKAGVQQILLNGYTPVGTKLRQVKGKRQRVQLFAPIALGGLDVVEESPSENVKAILSRGPILHMVPSPDGNPPEGDLDDEEDYVDEVVSRIRIGGMGWCITNREYLRAAKPEPAEGAVRRWRQIWRPMLAIADGAGEDWPVRGREACVKLRHGYAAADDEEERALASMKGELAGMKREMAGMFGED
jgi:Protein of unknown function (DUF3631)